MMDDLAKVIEKAEALEKAIDDFMEDLHMRASWDKANIDVDGTVILACGIGVLHRLSAARAALSSAIGEDG